MKEFQFEGKWRKFVIEEALSETAAAKLENELGVLVKPADYNPDDNKVDIYPDIKPGEDNRVDRTSQYIAVQVGGPGEFKLIAIKGYKRSLDLIGMPYGSTRLAGFGIVMPESTKRPTVGFNDLKAYIIQLRRGLEGEAEAQRDFYKNWHNPD